MWTINNPRVFFASHVLKPLTWQLLLFTWSQPVKEWLLFFNWQIWRSMGWCYHDRVISTRIVILRRWLRLQTWIDVSRFLKGSQQVAATGSYSTALDVIRSTLIWQLAILFFSYTWQVFLTSCPKYQNLGLFRRAIPFHLGFGLRLSLKVSIKRFPVIWMWWPSSGLLY